MHSIKRIFTLVLTGAFLISGNAVYAEAGSIDKLQQQQQQIDADIKANSAQLQQFEQEMQGLQQEIQTWDKKISETNKQIEQANEKLVKTQQVMDQKKLEIVQLENKVHMRKDVMKQRLLAEQGRQSSQLFLEALVGSKSFADLIDRVNAVSVILSADKNILDMQQTDLERIEREKAALAEQEKIEKAEMDKLAQLQIEQQQNQQKRQQAVASVQAKATALLQQNALKAEEKAAISSKIAQQIKEEEERKRQEEQQRQLQQQSTAGQDAGGAEPAGGREILVEATAYSWEESHPGEYITRWGGYNVKENPNLKLIAVDPTVIKLGSTVWVEGYGEAIAADTGGAIKGYRIDVLKPSGDAARAWGRRFVKLKILN